MCIRTPSVLELADASREYRISSRSDTRTSRNPSKPSIAYGHRQVDPRLTRPGRLLGARLRYGHGVELGDLERSEFELVQELIEGFSANEIAQRSNLSERAVRTHIRLVFAKLGVTNRRELREKEQVEGWRHAYARIRAFVEAHGHSRLPEGYRDEYGPLDGLVSNLRLHHSGRSYLGGPPPPRESQSFGLVNWETDLDRLPGWSWELDDPSEFPMLRSRRYATWAIRDLNLKDGDEVDYIRGVTTAFRASEERPWPRMRELVREKGIAPSAAALADFFPDRYRSFIGVIVTADGRAFGFGLLYFGDPEHPSQWDRIFLLDWRELSEPKARKPHEEQIGIASELLEKEST
jgi:DNA-binding CsgD family transcriptional regulator